MIRIMGLGSVLLLLVVLGPMIIPDEAWPEVNRNFLAVRGLDDTGANNLVSAIYLGYRAYDTIGETIVLLAAVAGALYLITSPSAQEPADITTLDSIEKKKHATRTNVISMTTGKLAPVVMLFGWYVMFFGHQSPGGGFQGGVVLASGLLFIALGREKRQVASIITKDSLRAIEVGSLFAILFMVFIPLLFGSFVLENPFASADITIPKVLYIIGFNVAIGLKVGSGLALLGLLMMDMKYDD
ncbi:MAG: hypothetical protein LDL24_07055 [Treponema sp.]|nr:hypothetical protein [Treponema sp.]